MRAKIIRIEKSFAGFSSFALLLFVGTPFLFFAQKVKTYTHTYTVITVPQHCSGAEVLPGEQAIYIRENSKPCDRENFKIYNSKDPSLVIKEGRTDENGCFVFTAEEGAYNFILGPNYLVPPDCPNKDLSAGFYVLKKAAKGDRKILLVIPTLDCCKGQVYE